MLRDINERGRELEQILNQYITFVKPAFEEFCLPVSILLNKTSLLHYYSCFQLYFQKRYHVYKFDTFHLLPHCYLILCPLNDIEHVYLQTKKYADVIIPRGADNHGESVGH